MRKLSESGLRIIELLREGGIDERHLDDVAFSFITDVSKKHEENLFIVHFSDDDWHLSEVDVLRSEIPLPSENQFIAVAFATDHKRIEKTLFFDGFSQQIHGFFGKCDFIDVGIVVDFV